MANGDELDIEKDLHDYVGKPVVIRLKGKDSCIATNGANKEVTMAPCDESDLKQRYRSSRAGMWQPPSMRTAASRSVRHGLYRGRLTTSLMSGVGSLSSRL